MAMLETEGVVKLVADKKTKQVLGVHIVGPEASTMISEAALGLEMAAFLEDFAMTSTRTDARRGPHGGVGARDGRGDSYRESVTFQLHIKNRPFPARARNAFYRSPASLHTLSPSEVVCARLLLHQRYS
jgi:hypothetical protein